MMNSNSLLHSGVLTVTFVTAISAIGCRNTGPKSSDFFTPDEVRSIDTTLDHQIASGARHDGMLREEHFDGARLNATGRAKLERMLACSGAVVVYLPGQIESTIFDARKETIFAYSKDHGRSVADVTIKTGVNPGTIHLAGPDLIRYSKTELGKGDDESAQAASAGDSGLSGAGNAAAGAGGAKPGG
jgi:hypothetical protein